MVVSRVALIADAVSLITNARRLKLQPPQLTASACHCNQIHLTSSLVSSVFLHIFFLSLSPFTSHTSSVPLLLHCFPVCWPFFMVVWLNWFFSPLPFSFVHFVACLIVRKHTYVNTQDTVMFVCLPVLSTIIDLLFEKVNIPYAHLLFYSESCTHTENMFHRPVLTAVRFWSFYLNSSSMG